MRRLSPRRAARGLAAAVGLCACVPQRQPGDSTAGDATADVHASEAATDALPTTTEATDTTDTGDEQCQRWYRDRDGDGFGDPQARVVACSPEPGLVLDASDCYDDNADAHPGQPTFFGVHRGDASFDYDCDGAATTQTDATGACALPPACALSEAGQGWWHGTVAGAPGCGGEQTWLVDCTSNGPGCDPVLENRTQLCR